MMCNPDTICNPMIFKLFIRHTGACAIAVLLAYSILAYSILV